jgi:DNA invertase Pin-like site-specific DNA recombinase
MSFARETACRSGTRAKSDRPELAKLLDHVRAGDVVTIYSLSRLARSIRHLLDVAENLRARDIGLKSLTEGFDTTTVSGRFIFNLLACVSQMEVELLRERTHAGLRAARARGRVGGRPKSLDPVKLKVV